MAAHAVLGIQACVALVGWVAGEAWGARCATPRTPSCVALAGRASWGAARGLAREAWQGARQGGALAAGPAGGGLSGSRNLERAGVL